MTDYEKAYRDLRAAVEALAQKFDSEAEWGRGLVDPTWSNCFASAERQLRALLAPTPASEPLGPTAEVSPSPKAAQSPASGTAREGDRCPFIATDPITTRRPRDDGWRCGETVGPTHYNHVLYDADGERTLYAGGWTLPAPTPPTTVQADAGHHSYYSGPFDHAGPREDCHICPPMTAAQVQADRDATCTPAFETSTPSVQADGDAGQARLMSEEDDGPECETCGKTTCPDAELPSFSSPLNCAYTPIYEALKDAKDCDYGCARDLTNQGVRLYVVPAVKRIVDAALAARQSDSDATEREALAKAWDEGATRVHESLAEHAWSLEFYTDDNPYWIAP